MKLDISLIQEKKFIINIREDHYYNQPPLQVEIGETPHLTVQYF